MNITSEEYENENENSVGATVFVWILTIIFGIIGYGLLFLTFLGVLAGIYILAGFLLGYDV